MVLKLYGFPYSTCTKRVATALKETNTPFELVEVDLTKGAHKAEDFVAKQPFGQVPYIVRILSLKSNGIVYSLRKG
jgi:glutathione S-transferase